MWHSLVGDESEFFRALIDWDEQKAADVRLGGCECGGRLDRADYRRKVRGIPAEWEGSFDRRISFCCAEEGCRRRKTPPSVRFFGRRVYAAALLLACCARWVTARQASVAGRTVGRWRQYFRTRFVASAFWQGARAQLMPPPTEDLPASLLERFGARGSYALQLALSFLSPLTTRSAS